MKNVEMYDMSKVVEVGVILSHDTDVRVVSILRLIKTQTQFDMDSYFNICCILVRRWKDLKAEETSHHTVDEFGYVTDYYNNSDLLYEALLDLDLSKI